MKKYIDWIIHNKVASAFILLAAFATPLIIVQMLFINITSIRLFQSSWSAGELLGYIAAFLAFVSTTLLGAIAIWQNEQSQRLNKSMQMLQQAQFVSMVSIISVEVNEQSDKYPNYVNHNYPNPEIINMAMDGFTFGRCRHIDLTIQNDSDYPIVQLNSHAGDRGRFNCELNGMGNVSQAIYIAGHQQRNIRIVIPAKLTTEEETYERLFKLDFVNVFDYTTETSLFLTLPKDNYKLEYKFRIAKIIDVKPSAQGSI